MTTPSFIYFVNFITRLLEDTHFRNGAIWFTVQYIVAPLYTVYVFDTLCVFFHVIPTI